MAAAKLRSVRDKEFSVSGALLDTAALGSLTDARAARDLPGSGAPGGGSDEGLGRRRRHL